MDNNKILKVNELKNLSTDMLVEAYKNGYRIEDTGKNIENVEILKSPVIKSLAICTSITVGAALPILVINQKGFTVDGYVPAQCSSGIVAGSKMGFLLEINADKNAYADFLFTYISPDGNSHNFSLNDYTISMGTIAYKFTANITLVDGDYTLTNATYTNVRAR